MHLFVEAAWYVGRWSSPRSENWSRWDAHRHPSVHDGARCLKSHLSYLPCGQKISSSGSSGSSHQTLSSSFLRETKEKTHTQQLLPVPDQSVQDKTTMLLQSETVLLHLSCPATASFYGTFCKIWSSRGHDSCALDGFEVQPLDHTPSQQLGVGQQIRSVEKAHQVTSDYSLGEFWK